MRLKYSLYNPTVLANTTARVILCETAKHVLYQRCVKLPSSIQPADILKKYPKKKKRISQLRLATD